MTDLKLLEALLIRNNVKYEKVVHEGAYTLIIIKGKSYYCAEFTFFEDGKKMEVDAWG